MSFEVRGRCETPSYFLSICEFLSFNLWRCGRLIFFRLLFAIANNCLWLISDFENEFLVAICQIQQSTIATASLGLLKPAEVVSRSCWWKSFPLSVFRFPFVRLLPPLVRIIGIYFLFYRNEFRGKSRCVAHIKLRRQKNYSLLITLSSLKKLSSFVSRLSTFLYLCIMNNVRI